MLLSINFVIVVLSPPGITNASKSFKPYLAADWMFMINLIAKGKVYRTKDTYIVLGKEGNSSKKNPSVYVDKKYYKLMPKDGIIPIPSRIFRHGGWVKVKIPKAFEGSLPTKITDKFSF